MKILLIEDDLDLAETMRDGLARDYNVDTVHTGELGIRRAQYPNGKKYDLILLDVVLPDHDGISVCKTLRAQHVTTPVLMLTAEQSIDSKVAALDGGADDYLTKPFNFSELLARMRALSRRSPENFASSVVVIGDVTIDLIRHRVERAGTEITLRRKEFILLEYLAQHQNQVVTRQMILDHVWESNADPSSNTVDVHINYLRGKLDQRFRTKLIKTVPGIGYKLEL